MRAGQRQQGLSAIGALGGMLLLVSIITLLLRLGPHYLDWQTMQSVFKSLPVGEVHTMSKDDIREMLGKRFRVNSLRDFDLKEIVQIDRQKAATTVSVAYEIREPIVANVDAVLSFSEQYQYH